MTRSVIVQRQASREEEERLETDQDQSSSLAFNFIEPKKRTGENFFPPPKNQPQKQPTPSQRHVGQRKASAVQNVEPEIVACSQCGQTSTNVKTLRRQSSQQNQQPQPPNQVYFNICSNCLIAASQNSKSINMRAVANMIYHNSHEYKLTLQQPTKSSTAKQVQQPKAPDQLPNNLMAAGLVLDRGFIMDMQRHH